MPKCSIKKCKNHSRKASIKDGVSYFRFPKNEIERETWRQIIAKERGDDFFKPKDSSVVCSSHFIDSDMYTKTGRRRIKKHVLPRIEIDIIPTSQPENVALSTATIAGSIEGSTSQKTATTTHYKKRPDPNVINRSTPSPTSSGLTSIFDSPKTSFFIKKLITCKKAMELKDKQIQNLKKKNNRLMKRNLNLKEIVADMKKKRLVNESLSMDLTTKLNDANDKVKKKKTPFAKYPPELRKFALMLHFYSPAAYNYTSCFVLEISIRHM